MTKQEFKDSIGNKIGHTWDGKIYVYQDNACDYVEVTELFEDEVLAFTSKPTKGVEG